MKKNIDENKNRKMKLLFKSLNGWPNALVTENFSGQTSPEGHIVFDSWDDVNAWKEQNEHLRPENFVNKVNEPVPEEVPLWAFRKALRKRNLIPVAMSIINQLPEEDRQDALDHLEYGNYIARNHPLVIEVGQIAKKTESDLDEIFIEAGKAK